MTFNESIKQLTPSTRNHSSNFNEVYNQLLENTKYNKGEIEKVAAQIGDLPNEVSRLESEIERVELEQGELIEQVNSEIERVELEKANVTHRHDVSEIDGLEGVGGSSNWDDIQGKPETFPPNTHTHSKSDITDLPTNLVTQTMLNDIGLGDTCKRLETGVNFDNVTQQGNFMLYQPKNAPSTHQWMGEWWYLSVRKHDDSFIEQEVTNLNPNNMSPYRSVVATWKRIKSAGKWFDWCPCEHPTIALYEGYNADFNLLTLHGKVLVGGNSTAQQCKNAPSDQAGILEVMPIVGNMNGSGVLQRYTPYSDCTRPLIRRFYDYTSSWSNWKVQDADSSNSLGAYSHKDYSVYLGSNPDVSILNNTAHNQNYDCWVHAEQATSIGLPDAGNWHVSFKKHAGSDGYGTQIAMPYGRNEIYVRASSAKSWNSWSSIGGGSGVKSVQRGYFETVYESSSQSEKSIVINSVNPSKCSVNVYGNIVTDSSKTVSLPLIKSLEPTQITFLMARSDFKENGTIGWEIVEYV